MVVLERAKYDCVTSLDILGKVVIFSAIFQGSDIKCISEEHYGYYHGKPCLLLKLNRIYGWRPVPYYNLTEVAESDMPQDLKDHIVKVRHTSG